MRTLLGSEQEQICISPRDSGVYLVAGKLKLAQGRVLQWVYTAGLEPRGQEGGPAHPQDHQDPPTPQLPRALLCPG